MSAGRYQRGARVGVLWLATGAVAAGCGETQKPAPSQPSSIEVQYEDVPSAPGPKPAPAAAAPAASLEYWKGRGDLIKAPPPPTPSELKLPKVERWKLKNGLDVIVVARHELPVVGFSIAIKAGGYDEDKTKTLGVASFTAEMLRRGTKTRSADQISDAIDFAGGMLDTTASQESTSASCAVLSKDARLCIDLLADMMQRPTFPEQEMGEVRDQFAAMLAARFDNPPQLASEHFDNLLFGEKHPDGWVLTPEDVAKISRDQLEAFWRTYYRPNNALLAVAGDVNPARLRADLERAFGRWPRADIPPRPAFKVPAVNATRVLIVDKPDLTQSTVVFGHPGIRHADPAWYAVTLMNYVLGGSDFSSRLMSEVRARRGLTYGIGSSFGASLYQGAFRISASTKNANAWEALVASLAEIRRMRQEGATADEVAKAKGYYAGSYPFKLQTAGGIAASIVGAELHGLGIPYVTELPLRLAAVGLPDVKQAAETWLHPDTMWVVIVGRGDEVEPDVVRSGLPYERIGFKEPISFMARARARKQKQEPAPQPPSAPSPPAQAAPDAGAR